MRALYVCNEKRREPIGEDVMVYNLHLLPVEGDDNKEFFAGVPGGSINLGHVNEEIAGQFTAGKEFYIDITPKG